MVPASVKAGRRRVSAAEACLRSCGLMRWRGATTRGTGWIQVAAFQGAASKFRLRVGWFYIALIGRWSGAAGVLLNITHKR